MSDPSLEATVTLPASDLMPRFMVVAAPFSSFARVLSFVEAVKRAPGVRRATPRQMRSGILRLAIDYNGQEPLAGALANLSDFPVESVAQDGDSIVVNLASEPRVPA